LRGIYEPGKIIHRLRSCDSDCNDRNDWMVGKTKMKVTYRNGIPTKSSLEKIINDRYGFRISDIYSAKYPRIIVSGEKGNANTKQLILDLKAHGVEVASFELSKGMANGMILVKPK
jgi:hypothetical protein